MSFKKKSLGFTLIELLVVIAIISLLASIVLTSLGSARIKARDSARIQTLHQMRNALELYYADNGKYPESDEEVSDFDANYYSAETKSSFYLSLPKDNGFPDAGLYTLSDRILLEFKLEGQNDTCWYNDSRGVGSVPDLTPDAPGCTDVATW